MINNSGGYPKYINTLTLIGFEIYENRHLPCITQIIGIYGKNLIFTRNIKIFACPAA